MVKFNLEGILNYFQILLLRYLGSLFHFWPWYTLGLTDLMCPDLTRQLFCTRKQNLL